MHDYILTYSPTPISFKEHRNKVILTDKQAKVYTNPNNDPKGNWRTIPLTAQAGHATKDQYYEIQAPGEKIFTPPPGRCWGIAEATFKKYREEGRIYFGRDNNSQPNLIRYLYEVEGITPGRGGHMRKLVILMNLKKSFMQFSEKKQGLILQNHLGYLIE